MPEFPEASTGAVALCEAPERITISSPQCFQRSNSRQGAIGAAIALAVVPDEIGHAAGSAVPLIVPAYGTCGGAVSLVNVRRFCALIWSEPGTWIPRVCVESSSGAG